MISCEKTGCPVNLRLSHRARSRMKHDIAAPSGDQRAPLSGSLGIAQGDDVSERIPVAQLSFGSSGEASSERSLLRRAESVPAERDRSIRRRERTMDGFAVDPGTTGKASIIVSWPWAQELGASRFPAVLPAALGLFLRRRNWKLGTRTGQDCFHEPSIARLYLGLISTGSGRRRQSDQRSRTIPSGLACWNGVKVSCIPP